MDTRCIYAEELKLLKQLTRSKDKEMQDAIKRIIGTLNAAMTRVEYEKMPPQV